LTWQPLSIREGRKTDDGPYEGVPAHLVGPLREWVDWRFGGAPGSAADNEEGSRLVAAIRYAVTPVYNERLTVRRVTFVVSTSAPYLMLDVVDAVLHLKEFIPTLPFDRMQLDELLQIGGSVWQVGPDQDCLVRRVDPTATAAFVQASSPSDVASAELGEAWTTAYGRNPNASDAWDHSIKAAEAVLIPIVTPTKAKATLGDVVGTLNSQGHLWRLALQGHDGSESVGPLVSMLRLMWPNPDRHGGQGSRVPSLDEAQAVVHLAVTIVQWARSGVLSKRLRPLRGLVLFHHRSRDAPTLVDLLAVLPGPCTYRGVVDALSRTTCLARWSRRLACMLDVPAEPAS
jgi:hypothetical protein